MRGVLKFQNEPCQLPFLWGGVGWGTFYSKYLMQRSECANLNKSSVFSRYRLQPRTLYHMWACRVYSKKLPWAFPTVNADVPSTTPNSLHMNLITFILQ